MSSSQRVAKPAARRKLNAAQRAAPAAMNQWRARGAASSSTDQPATQQQSCRRTVITDEDDDDADADAAYSYGFGENNENDPAVDNADGQLEDAAEESSRRLRPRSVRMPSAKPKQQH